MQKGEAGNVRKVASGVVLIAFYNQNAIGVRCLERALKTAGYGVKIVFFKDYHSKTPSLPDKKELRLLCQLVRREKPLFVGLSVMSTLYLEAVSLVNRVLKECAIPLVWGGVYPTMFPERAMKEADFVLRGEGECLLWSFAVHWRENFLFPGWETLSTKKKGKSSTIRCIH